MIAAQQDYLNVLHNARSRNTDPGALGGDVLNTIANARSRLAGWDMPQRAIDSITITNQVMQEFPIVSPITGDVIQKGFVNGSTFAPGEVLARIAPTDSVRVIAYLSAGGRGFAIVGSRVVVRDPSGAASDRAGRVVAVSASLDDATRTLPVFIACSTSRSDLRPGAAVTVDFARTLGSGFAVPESSIIHANGRSWVCVELESGRFALREVAPGESVRGEIEIVRGLSEGDRIATSGQLLICAQLRTALGAGP
jgi:Cu(I)/Ag(I) efflux system membrane fusion protein